MNIKIDNKIIKVDMICYLSVTDKKLDTSIIGNINNENYIVYGNIHMINGDVISIKIGNVNLSNIEDSTYAKEYLTQQEDILLDKFKNSIYNNIVKLNYK